MSLVTSAATILWGRPFGASFCTIVTGVHVRGSCTRGVAHFGERVRIHVVKQCRTEQQEADLERAMREALSQTGKSLWDLSHESPLLVIFLRHFG